MRSEANALNTISYLDERSVTIIFCLIQCFFFILVYIFSLNAEYRMLDFIFVNIIRSCNLIPWIWLFKVGGDDVQNHLSLDILLIEKM